MTLCGSLLYHLLSNQVINLGYHYGWDKLRELSCDQRTS